MAAEKPVKVPLKCCKQLKIIANRIAKNYDCNIKIEISVDKNSGSIIINVTEYNIKNL